MSSTMETSNERNYKRKMSSEQLGEDTDDRDRNWSSNQNYNNKNTYNLEDNLDNYNNENFRNYGRDTNQYNNRRDHMDNRRGNSYKNSLIYKTIYQVIFHVLDS